MNEMLENLRVKNPHIQIHSVHDPEFSRFGEVLDVSEFGDLIRYLELHTTVPSVGNEYVPHRAELGDLVSDLSVIHNTFGRVPLEYGYVNGNNSKLNALEFHKSSEINVCVTPLVLLLAHIEDIDDSTFHSSKVTAFYIPQNTAIEVYSTTLHFSPCKVTDSGFKCAVILPYGTNMEFVSAKGNQGKYGKFLFKTNKWLLNHPENTRMVELNAISAIHGENIEIYY
ncbi:MAG TPA: DUF4867 domain-containing protein [Erysipelotrichaceae bacterium]|nr:DUF4867 domain-containing protein [Erysipelotrichaceae bacterium]HBZ41692.1 DUF4867 domain-containing protein [Erysipelotrichaceae bacterium]